MSYLSMHFPSYDCDIYGNVYNKEGKPLKQFNSNKYKQVLFFDSDHERRVLGVHQVVAMKYLDYYDGCMIHHLDGDGHNNNLSNLEVVDYVQHYLYHIDECKIGKNQSIKEPWNKGLEMDEEFSKKCKLGILKSKARKAAKEKLKELNK